MKVIVVGAAGIFGASAAYHLARFGAEVVMVDPVRLGRATAAGAGIICPWSSAIEAPEYYALCSAGARFYPGLIAQLAEDGEHDTSYRRVGGLIVSNDPETLDQAEQRARQRGRSEPEAGTIDRVTPDEARALFPPLRVGRGGCFISGGARVDGRKLAAAMVAAAQRHGAVWHEAEAQLVMSSGRVTGIVADGKAIEADEVIVAAGAWAPPILSPLGIGLAVEPQRGQIVHLRRAGIDTGAWPVLLPMTSHYLLAFDESRIVVGATREAGTGFDYRTTAAGVMSVLEAALSVAPGLADFEILETRIGFRPMSSDICPMIGRVPGLDGLVIGNGLGANGLTMGPYAGSVLADIALGRDPGIDLAPYDPVRHPVTDPMRRAET